MHNCTIDNQCGRDLLLPSWVGGDACVISLVHTSHWINGQYARLSNEIHTYAITRLKDYAIEDPCKINWTVALL